MALNRNDVINAYKIWLDRDYPDQVTEEELNQKWDHVRNNNWDWARLSDDMKLGSDEFKNKANAKIDWWYSEESGYGINREPSAKEREDLYNHIYHRGWEHLDEIEPGLRDLGAQSEPTTEVVQESGKYTLTAEDKTFILDDKGGPLFGDADYRELLIQQAPAGPSALEGVRDKVKIWIHKHRDAGTLDHILAKTNQPNTTPGENDTGLYERINTGTPGNNVEEGGRFFTQWGDKAIDTDKDNKFEYSDILASRAGGHSTFQVYSFMARNQDKVPDGQATDEYNRIRTELITRANETGNLRDYEGWGQGDSPADVWFSWRHTLENPLWQDIGRYLKQLPDRDYSGKDTAWWMYNPEAYRAIRDWQQERAGQHDFLELDDNGRLSKGVTTQEQVDLLIGSGTPGHGGPGGVGAGEPGKFWHKWGAEGPRLDGEPELSEPLKFAAGVGLAQIFTDDDTEDILESLEQRFLKEMYQGYIDDSSMDPTNRPEMPPLYTQSLDEWGLDIVREGMQPSDFEEDWFEDDELVDSYFNRLAYGGYESIDWDYYNDSEIYKEAQEALSMDAVFDSVSEIREANVWVHGKLKDPDSSHVEDHIPYEPKFDKNTPIPDPIEIDVGGYKTPKKVDLVQAPAGPDKLTINIPKVNISSPKNLPSDLKIAGGAS